MTIEIFKNLKIEIKYVTKSTIIFENLILDNQIIATSWLNVIDFLEIFQSYTKNQLSFNAIYSFSVVEFELYKSKSEEILLSMSFKDDIYAFSKLNAAKISHKINRVLARCDLLYQK